MSRRIQINRLRNRHGLQFSQAMLIAELVFGPDRDDARGRWKGPLVREDRQ